MGPNPNFESSAEFAALQKQAAETPAAQEARAIAESPLFDTNSPLRFKSLIGEGITGKVAHAKYSPTASHKTPGEWIEKPTKDTDVAVKIALDTDQTAAGALNSERRLMGDTNILFDPNDSFRPVRLLGYGTTPVLRAQRPYLIMEYVPENMVKLDTLLAEKGGKLSIRETLQLGLGVSRILQQLHASDIIHDDMSAIKLDNIFFDPQTNQGRLIDFGNSIDLAQAKKDNFKVNASPATDREGLAQILLRVALDPNQYTALTTGNIERQEFYKKLDALPTTVLPTNIKTILTKAFMYQYPQDAEGTNQMYKDMIDALPTNPPAAKQVPSRPQEAPVQAVTPPTPEQKPAFTEGTQIALLDSNGRIDEGWTITKVTPAKTAFVTREINGKSETVEVSLATLATLEERHATLAIQEMVIDAASTFAKLFEEITNFGGITRLDGTIIDPAAIKKTLREIANANLGPGKGIKGLDGLPNISGLREKTLELISAAKAQP